MSNGVADFVGECGECTNGYYSAASRAGLQPNQSATVNGSLPQDCVVANNGARVYAIELQQIAGLYGFQVRVEAQGPSGAFSGAMHLAFQDSTGDVYYLKIYSSSREWHTVSFNSDSAAIKRIFWSDYDFTVSGDGVSSDKAEFQVQSPARKLQTA